MKNIWKWIVGIILVLLVVAAIAVPFVLHRKLALNPADSVIYSYHPREGLQNGPMPGKFFGEYHSPKGDRRSGFARFHHGGMLQRGMHFGPGFLLFGGLMRLVPLALLALVIVVSYQMGKRASATVTAAVAPAATHACPKCGNLVQDDWKHCPSCGKKQ